MASIVSTSVGHFRGGTTGLTGADAVLKIVYEGAVRDLLNSKTVTNRLLNRDLAGLTVSGSSVRGSIRTQRNIGNQYIPEGAKIPVAGKQDTTQTQWRTRYNYGRAQVTGQFITATGQSRGAFIEGLDYEINGLAQDMHHEQQRVIFSDGSGRLAKVSATNNLAASEVLTLADAGGIVSQANGTQYIENGMRVCFFDNTAEGSQGIFSPTDANYRDADTSGIATFTVSAVDYTAGTVTINNLTNTDIVANDYMYKATEAGLLAVTPDESARAQEMFGLAAAISNVNPPVYGVAAQPEGLQHFGNIDRSSQPLWRSTVVSNGGVPVPFSQSMFQQAIDTTDIAADGRVRYMITTHGIRRQFASELIDQKRYPAVMDLDGGFKAVTYNGIPIIVDKDCTRGRVYGIDPEVMAIIKEKDWGFVDRDGRVLQRIVDFDAYEVTMCVYQQLVCTAPNRQFVIQDIQDA